jgi:diadenosine tetraphosphate (Ap4A) HIT family hydrolase
MSHCIICEKQNLLNNYIYSGDFISVSHGPIDSGILGYLLIEPKRHVEDWDELTDEEFFEITSIIRKVTAFLRENYRAERVYTVAISELVRHLHIHVIPRSVDNELKGLPLIEQVTQQTNKSLNSLSEKEIDNFIMLARNYM